MERRRQEKDRALKLTPYYRYYYYYFFSSFHLFSDCNGRIPMEKISPLHLNTSLPQNPFTHKRNTSNPIIHVPRGVADTSMETPPSPSPSLGFSTHLHALNDPIKLNFPYSCKKIHAQIIKTSNNWNSTQTAQRLINLYIQSDDFRSAAMVLFTGFERDPLSWSRWVEEFGIEEGRFSGLVEIFRELHRKGNFFNGRVLIAFLKACASMIHSQLGVEIHSYVIKSGFDSDVYLKSALLEFYGNCFGLDYAHQIFDETPVRNTLLWNKVIALNSGNGSWLKVLKLFREMQFSGVRADGSTLAKVLQACGRGGAFKEGKQIHGYVIRSLQMSRSLICNSLISMYSKSFKLEMARMVFDSMDSPSLVSWNSMISGYALNGILDKAWKLFDEMELSETKPDIVTWNSLVSGHSIHGHDKIPQILRKMQVAGLKPNSSSIASALQAISEMSSVELGKEIHGYVLRNGIRCDKYVGTSLIDMYIKSGCLTNARLVFDNMKDRNIFTWNSLISGYAYNGLFDEVMKLLNRMEKEGIKPNLVTWNSLIAGYAMRGLSKQALELIHQLKKTSTLHPNVVSWTALISGCSRIGNYIEALDFCIKMQQGGIKPNSTTIASLLRACAALALLQKGRELHCYAIRNDFDENIIVATALVDMYCKSCSLHIAHSVFRKIKRKNLASWNSMIMGFSVHGLGKEAMSLFSEMCESGFHPDGISLTAILSGCRHSGFVGEGWKYFDSMRTEFGITPTLKHYACMVDLLGRSGYLDEAWDFLQSMPLEPDASLWGALLGACRLHKNLELAEIAAQYLFELEPHNSGNYLLLMNLYATENRWQDVENLKDIMSIRGAKSRSGWSWIQVKNKVHVFTVEGKPHPDIGEIYFELYHLISEIKNLGYVPDTNCIVQNIDEEEKEKTLLSHTEKLAITYGLINTGNGVPIRVIKNTRVCNDCHMVAKYMSQISGREIFLRDGVRFHHFSGGRCSCNDYW
ncbi:hypothetical protein MRB53_002525 [Persea americana]|uniref:Uncharacterized protein n=1 Tax=Persea americana TaxID=3435 RepID=A0ACC2MX48_PERAE|nr:hypothetical protein MRB53_002525 [Persea americana]